MRTGKSLLKNENGESMQKIVIADDSSPTREMLSVALNQAGYEVISASDGNQAFEAVCLHHPDIVLLDITMPGMNGLQVCQKMKANPATQHIPVACMTASRSSEHIAAAKEAGAVFCWFKPLCLQEVLQHLGTLKPEKPAH
jgi:CheY-like chemotaxis protein